MRRALGLVVPSVFLLACGSTPPPAASPAGTSASDPCLASLSRVRPTMPVEEVGSLVVHLRKEDCSVETRGVDGAAKPAMPCTSKSNAREAARLAACSLGGDALWPRNKDQDEKGDVIELSVGRFTRTDAAADLALICAPFTSLKIPSTGKTLDAGGLDPSQRATIRASLLQEAMTSRQWRLWLHGLRENREASIATLRAAAKAANLTCESEWTTAP